MQSHKAEGGDKESRIRAFSKLVTLLHTQKKLHNAVIMMKLYDDRKIYTLFDDIKKKYHDTTIYIERFFILAITQGSL